MSMFKNDLAETKAPEVNNILADGIYFDLPEAKYHSLHRLSASGIKDILTSIATFWRKSWMCPDKVEDDDTKAQILGRAFHVAIFEPHDLSKLFVGEPNWAALEGLIKTDTTVKERLKELGEPQTKTGELALDRAYRLRDMGCEAPIKSIIQAKFLEDLDDRQPIKDEYWRQIGQAVDRIRANPEVNDLVTGGASEVTILWTCPESGEKIKARIDKLKADCFVDLKSFANSNGKPVEQAIADQVRFYRYYISMRVYQEAISMIRVLNLQIQDDRPEMHHKELVEELRAKTQPHQPWLFFQEKGGVPNLLARKLVFWTYPDGVDEQNIGAENHDIKPVKSALCHKADMEIEHAKRLFTHACDVYGTDGKPWYPFTMFGEIGDDHFSDWFLDAVPS